MNRKYIILILMTIFFLTGCTITYDIEIDKDLQIIEKIELLEANEELLKYGDDLTNVIREMTAYFVNHEENPTKINIKTENIIPNTQNTGFSSITFDKIFAKMEYYEKSLPLQNYVIKRDVSIDNNGNYVFSWMGFNFDIIKKLVSEYKYKLNIDGLILRIKVPYDVINHNADQVDEATNTYIWNIFEANAATKKIDITFTTTKKIPEKKNALDNAGGSIINFVTGGRIDGSKFMEEYGFSLWCSIFLIVVVIATFITRKIIKSNNKL